MKEWDVNRSADWSADWNNAAQEPEYSPVESFTTAGITVRLGDRVRLQPRKGGDIMDIALQGKVAIIEAIERDFEDRLHLAVVLEDDPGRDLGMLRQPGHRFFFSPDEIEPLPVNSTPITGEVPHD
jgi:hypothetical protein